MTLLRKETEGLFAEMVLQEDALEQVAAAGAEYIRWMLKRPIHHFRLTCVISPRRCIVVERTDGRRCWLSVGKKQPLTVGSSGWVNVSKQTSVRTACQDSPLVFRPSDEAYVTCLTCLAHGRFEFGAV